MAETDGGGGGPSARPQRASTIYGRFAALPKQQRIFLGFMGMVFSGAGLWLSEANEKKYHERAKREEEMRLRAAREEA
jgi:hypothetical protein